MHPQMAQDTARPGIKSGATGVSCRCDHDMDREGIGKRTIKGGFNFMKRKRISFLAMLILAVILLMPASIQAATKPGAVKLTKITAVDYNKISIKWKKASGATNYIVYYKKAGNSKWIKLKHLVIPNLATPIHLPANTRLLSVRNINTLLKPTIRIRRSMEAITQKG